MILSKTRKVSFILAGLCTLSLYVQGVSSTSERKHAASPATVTDHSMIKGNEFVSIEIKRAATPGIAPGQRIAIGIIAKTTKDKEYRTPGFPEDGSFRTIEWNRFKVEVEGGIFADGKVMISSNPSEIKNHQVKIKASFLKNPEIASELVLEIDYKGETFADFSGTPGKYGQSGQNGVRGNNAVTSSDRCSSGGNGGQGGNGGDGGQGQDLEVYAKMKYNEELKKELLEVRVKSLTTNKEQMYWVDPNGGSIKISADGGIGGAGGSGGAGGAGGNDTYSKTSGSGGYGGSGGNGGNGAKGGSITVYMDPSTNKLPNGVILFSNEGGAAGNRGQGGNGGAKGDYPSNWGQSGPSGAYGNAGTKGPEIKIIKQKVN